MNGRSTQHPQQGLPTADRRHMVHERRYDIRGYEREDGMLDVEGKIVDLKPHSFDKDVFFHPKNKMQVQRYVIIPTERQKKFFLKRAR